MTDSFVHGLFHVKPVGTPSFSKLTPNISKFSAWILQAFPKILLAVLSVFNGLQGVQADFFKFQIFRLARLRKPPLRSRPREIGEESRLST
jgi:hypothetical protein